MNDLKLLLNNLGLLKIATYIQSGNVVFQFNNLESIPHLEDKVAQSIFEAFNFSVQVIIVAETDLQRIVDSNPFASGNSIESLHCTFLKTIPEQVKIKTINQEDFGGDDCFVTDSVAYITCNLQHSQSKLTHGFLSRKLGVGCITKNWKTTTNLLELCKHVTSQ